MNSMASVDLQFVFEDYFSAFYDFQPEVVKAFASDPRIITLAECFLKSGDKLVSKHHLFVMCLI